MKSILAKFESKKLPYLQFQGLSTLNFGKFGTWEMGQIYKIHQKLISRKIGDAVK